MNVDRCDIFPKYISTRVEKLVQYPKFGPLLGEANLIHFCLFMDNDKIYFQKWNVSDAVVRTIRAHGKEAKLFAQFRPNDINWSSILNRFKRPPMQVNRTNADVRTGFRIGHDFLVKANFTFGLRFVEPGTAHVIQTLNVPLLFYLRNPKSKRRRDKGYFPIAELFSYDRRILLPSTCYRIPPGTGYILFSTQKNFFRLDVVEENHELGFRSEDPVATRVVKIEGMYDRPVRTPYVEDAETLNDEDLKDLDFHASYLSEASSEVVEFESESMKNFANYQAVQTFLLITNPPIERSVVVSHPDFVTAFRRLKISEYGDPKVALPASDGPSEPPLDLTLRSFEEEVEILMETDPQKIMEVNRLIEDLCSPHI